MFISSNLFLGTRSPSPSFYLSNRCCIGVSRGERMKQEQTGTRKNRVHESKGKKEGANNPQGELPLHLKPMLAQD